MQGCSVRPTLSLRCSRWSSTPRLGTRKIEIGPSKATEYDFRPPNPYRCRRCDPRGVLTVHSHGLHSLSCGLWKACGCQKYARWGPPMLFHDLPMIVPDISATRETGRGAVLDCGYVYLTNAGMFSTSYSIATVFTLVVYTSPRHKKNRDRALESN